MNAWQIALDVRHAQALDADSRASLQTLIGHLDALMGERTIMLADREQMQKLLEERKHVAHTLAVFYHSPLSISSVQPVLDLAEQMTPSLAKRERSLS